MNLETWDYLDDSWHECPSYINEGTKRSAILITTHVGQVFDGNARPLLQQWALLILVVGWLPHLVYSLAQCQILDPAKTWFVVT